MVEEGPSVYEDTGERGVACHGPLRDPRCARVLDLCAELVSWVSALVGIPCVIAC